LLWIFCQSVIGLFVVSASAEASLMDRTAGPLAISMILGLSCLGVIWRDVVFSRYLDGPGLERAWRRARDRSVSRLAIFALSLVVGGALAVLLAKLSCSPLLSCL
jgi:heme A synthase